MGAPADSTAAGGRYIALRVGSRLCAVPVGLVAETMRPLPVEPLPDAPPFVLGVSIIRGAPVPVVDVASLLAGPALEPGRFVTVRLGAGRLVALAVEEVIGVRDLPEEALAGVPPLLGEAGAHVVSSISTLDAEFLLVLRHAHLVPESAWRALEDRGGRP